jgi:alkylation response protein AidB-like acyl-CoA dehydrogenase
LCYAAFQTKENNDPEAVKSMLMAKYYASNMAVRVTGKSLQVHGAMGFSRDYPVERFYRDAKIMTMIEGSDQMMQLMISKYAGL